MLCEGKPRYSLWSSAIMPTKNSTPGLFSSSISTIPRTIQTNRSTILWPSFSPVIRTTMSVASWPSTFLQKSTQLGWRTTLQFITLASKDYQEWLSYCHDWWRVLPSDSSFPCVSSYSAPPSECVFFVERVYAASALYELSKSDSRWCQWVPHYVC